MERPSIRQLESLVAVADTRSFRKAATTLGISQPALSAQVQAAEHVLGIQVFERPSIRQLESLVAVADTRSFRKAATTLGISQPALSAQVQAAEHVLGIQVFERDRRSVLITPAGEDVVSRAREALIAVDAVGDAARLRSEPLVGSLRMGVIPTIAPYWLPAPLPRGPPRFPPLPAVP